MEDKFKKWLSNVWITTLIFSPSIAFANSGQDTPSHVSQGIDGLEALNSYGYARKKRKIF